jgi:alpha-N-arabinofuranosidase
LQTIYYPLQLFATYAKGKSLELLSDGPRYMTRRFGDVPYLDTSAALDNGILVLNVTNRHPSQAVTADVNLVDKQFSGAVTVMEVNGPDIKSENDFNITRVKAIQKSAAAQGKSLTYSFPAHSFTMLQVKLA